MESESRTAARASGAAQRRPAPSPRPGEPPQPARRAGAATLERFAREQYLLAGHMLDCALAQARLARASAPWNAFAAGLVFGRAIGGQWLARAPFAGVESASGSATATAGNRHAEAAARSPGKFPNTAAVLASSRPPAKRRTSLRSAPKAATPRQPRR